MSNNVKNRIQYSLTERLSRVFGDGLIMTEYGTFLQQMADSGYCHLTNVQCGDVIYLK